MKKASRIILTCVLALIVATPLMAADQKKAKKKKRKRPVRTFNVVRLPKSIELTADQKEKIAAINKEYAPKLRELAKKSSEVITAEQRKARREAFFAARKAGKKGKELRDAVNAASKITDEQKKQMAQINKERGSLLKEARAKVLEILTAEQKAKLKPVRKKGGKRKKKAKKTKSAN
ncbi:MAG: hypothetical protein Tsb009_36960 [Planctomycetaceae bacterium]